ncbi:MAG TPA: hypothetical protein VK483_09220 [Chitinophagaceae bacterium]|nr:hypothetical protein [Chitinophagaceae bacterium]
MRYKKNICCPVAGKRSLLFFLLLLPVLIQAQSDTTILADSLPQPIIEVPAEEQRLSTADTKSGVFLDKWNSTRDSSIVQRHLPDSVIKKMQQDDDFWYANAEFEEEKKPGYKRSAYTSLGDQQWFQVLLWLLIIGAFVAGIFLYLGLFRRKNKPIQSQEEELVTEDIFAINYRKEIDKAEANANYRLAIRLMFLRLLKVMAEKNIIQYKQDRTNLDYLLQLHPTVYYNNFFRITRNYEYSWYGKFEVGEGAYKMIRNDFDQFDRQLT